MNFPIDNGEFVSKFNRSLWAIRQPPDTTYRQTVRSRSYKSLVNSQIMEICFLIVILIEHTTIFLLTFRRKSSKTPRRDQPQRSILLPSKSLLYSCLHRNWIRALSFSNICLSFVYFLILMLKHYHPNLIHHSSITFYSLPLNLLQQIIINFSTFHLLIISISVFQYFLRYYRLLKNTYSSRFFNGQNLLLTNHTNVALILSGSLALIFAYNFIFYAPKYPQTISLLPLITLNTILLPLINLLIFSFILICFIIHFFYQSNSQLLSFENEQENLRLIIEKNTCIKCYSKILETNSNLIQDKDYSYKNLYKNFFPTNLRASSPFQTRQSYLLNPKKNYSQSDFSYEQQNDSEINSTNDFFFQTTLIKINHQHSLCHLCYFLLLLFLFKYILLTFPQYIILMIFHLRQFYQQFILKSNSTNYLIYTLYEQNELPLKISHYLFLLSRFGDSLLLTRLPYLIRRYFPCWCHINSKLLRKQQQISHQILTMKNSESSNNEPISSLDTSNSNDLPKELKQQSKHRRFRLSFQFVPLWSNNRPKSFEEHI